MPELHDNPALDALEVRFEALADTVRVVMQDTLRQVIALVAEQRFDAAYMRQQEHAGLLRLTQELIALRTRWVAGEFRTDSRVGTQLKLPHLIPKSTPQRRDKPVSLSAGQVICARSRAASNLGRLTDDGNRNRGRAQVRFVRQRGQCRGRTTPAAVVRDHVLTYLREAGKPRHLEVIVREVSKRVALTAADRGITPSTRKRESAWDVRLKYRTRFAHNVVSRCAELARRGCLRRVGGARYLYVIPTGEEKGSTDGESSQQS